MPGALTGPAVQTHQNNHLRIQRLRQTSSALDAQIRDTLTSLATARKDMVAIHTTKFPDAPNYPFAYQELLSYARRISKTTLPPAVTVAAASPSPDTQAAPDSLPQSAATPSDPSLTQSPVANGTSQHVSDPSTQQTSASMNTTLPEGISQYLNPLSGQPFCPWPPEDKIRSGSLASNQILAEKGIDPRNYDPATEEERKRKEDEERRAREEREKTDREERERQLRVERERLRAEREKQREKEQEEWRRASIATGQPDAPGHARTAGEKKQFQFTNLDDLDDDDEDDDD